MISTTAASTPIQNGMTSWQQVKQAVTTANSKPASIYFPTKAFVKASSTPQGNTI